MSHSDSTSANGNELIYLHVVHKIRRHHVDTYARMLMGRCTPEDNTIKLSCHTEVVQYLTDHPGDWKGLRQHFGMPIMEDILGTS